MNSKKILITGTAGFIGFHLAEKLLNEGHVVIGLDNINDYYDVNLKYARLAESGIKREDITWGGLVQSTKHQNYKFVRMNLDSKEELIMLFKKEKFDIIVNLAAQAGVRYSIENPDVYIASNINGFYNILEACRAYPVAHLVFASSSSVYGDSTEVPFREDTNVDKPISLYAATKKSGELMAYTYSHLYKIPTTGLRFFTVYGPWGRPDMAMSLFTEKIIKGEPIQVFNNGDLSRDFTYIDDIVEGVGLVIGKTAKSKPPYQILNIGNNKPVKLMDFIKSIEISLGIKANIRFKPMQPGDVNRTWADVSKLIEKTDYKPKTDLLAGISSTIKWYKFYNN